MSNFITTYTGHHFNPMAPDPELICIEDIAHALSLICRGNGQVKSYWSVGQHCINCAREAQARGLSNRVILACLLHDAGECYMSDVPRPLKQALPEYRAREDALLEMIYQKFLGSALTEEEQRQLNEIDDATLWYDLHVLLGETLPGGPPKMTSTTPPDFAALFRGLYRKLAESPVTAEAYRSFFRVLLDSREGAVYFHCAQGKDRTGIAALLALTALGVPHGAACADYFLSNVGLKPDLERSETRDDMKWPREVREKLFFVWPQILAEYFDSLTRGWGGPMGYLRGCLGLTDADLANLRESYLE